MLRTAPSEPLFTHIVITLDTLVRSAVLQRNVDSQVCCMCHTDQSGYITYVLCLGNLSGCVEYENRNDGRFPSICGRLSSFAIMYSKSFTLMFLTRVPESYEADVSTLAKSFAPGCFLVSE